MTDLQADRATGSGSFGASPREFESFPLPTRRRWPFLVMGIVLGAGGAAAAGVALGTDETPAELEEGIDLQLTTAPVETRDLIEEVEWLADLGYGTAVDIAAPVDGTVTSAVDVGTVLRRGDVALEIDETPLVILYGAVPNWRDLAEGDEGPDVTQLETNLVALGYDPDDTVTIDEEFTARTEDMVERWQEDLGVEVTGEVSTADFIVVDGPVSVTTAPAVGQAARSGSLLAAVSARALTTTVIGDALGEITRLLDIGADIEEGTVLYVADGVSVSADESLAGTQVTAHLHQSGDLLTTSRPVMEVSVQTLSVVVPVGLASSGDFEVGQEVSVELPDESLAAGVVVEVGEVAQTSGPGSDPTIDVVIEFTELIDDSLPASEVTVVVAGDSVLDAMVVPTRALVTLSEGGFAVEKVLTDTTTVLVGVETGTFADGVVEVESSQLEPGDELVVPQ